MTSHWQADFRVDLSEYTRRTLCRLKGNKVLQLSIQYSVLRAQLAGTSQVPLVMPGQISHVSGLCSEVFTPRRGSQLNNSRRHPPNLCPVKWESHRYSFECPIMLRTD